MVSSLRLENCKSALHSGSLVVILDNKVKGKMKGKTGPSLVDRVKIKVKKALGMNIFLCDTCKWDWRGACHSPARPNATWCPDYEKRGK